MHHVCVAQVPLPSERTTFALKKLWNTPPVPLAAMPFNHDKCFNGGLLLLRPSAAEYERQVAAVRRSPPPEDDVSASAVRYRECGGHDQPVLNSLFLNFSRIGGGTWKIAKPHQV